MPVDPLTLAVVRGGLHEVVEEMDSVLARTAFSPVISEAYDRANGVYYAADGGVAVQGATGLPIFIGAMQFAVQSVLESAASEGMDDGDVFILNDPFAGGTHLMDVKLVKPCYFDGELVCFLANTGHWVDIGGSTSGGTGIANVEIFQEGLQIPAMKIAERGKMNEQLRRLILANVRRPKESSGDFAAQFNALHVGERRLLDLVERHGLRVVHEVMDELRVRSSTGMKACIESIPDGTYEYVDRLDDDGWGDGQLEIPVTLTVTGDRMRFDLSHSSPIAHGPYNASPSVAISSCLVAIKHIFPDVPINAGCIDALEFTFAEASFTNAHHPAAVAAYNEVAQRIVDAVFGALAQAQPELSYAAGYGSVVQMSVAGTTEVDDSFVAYLFHGGGYGASVDSDGLLDGPVPIGIAHVPSMEVVEQRYPIRLRALAIREDSGGAGRHRGGCGVEYDYEFVGNEALLSVLGDRGVYPPFGIDGGLPGSVVEVLVSPDGSAPPEPLGTTKKGGIVLRKGGRIVVRTAGGGGYGDPLARPLQSCLDDARRGVVSPTRLVADYGVEVADDGPRELPARAAAATPVGGGGQR